MATSGERDLDRAEDLRARLKTVKGESARKELLRAAERLEKRGVKKISTLGRRRKKGAGPRVNYIR